MRVFESIPEEVELSPLEFLKWTGEPCAIRVGKGDETVVLMTLLHGNEPSGTIAFLEKLRELRTGGDLGKTVWFVFANPNDALLGDGFSDRFSGSHDPNRVWHEHTTPLVKELQDFLISLEADLFVDIHNTTGKNPPLAIISDMHIAPLAGGLTDTVLYFPTHHMAFGWMQQYCPSLVFECGKNTDEESHEHARKVVESILNGVEKRDVRVLSNPIPIRIAGEDVSISFDDVRSDVVIFPDVDKWNGTTCPQGTQIGFAREGVVIHPSLCLEGRRLITCEDTLFLLLTPSAKAIVKDTLGYSVNQIN